MTGVYKKKFASSPAESTKAKAPNVSGDNARSFDARPKPSDDRRRDARDRPAQHVDRIDGGLDADPGIEVETTDQD